MGPEFVPHEPLRTAAGRSSLQRHGGADCAASAFAAVSW